MRRPALLPIAATLLFVLACSGSPDDAPLAGGRGAAGAVEAEYATVALGMPEACEPSTRIYFRCDLQGGDVVTVCGNDQGADLWAKFVLEPADGGAPLVYPPGDPAADPLFLETRQYARVRGPAVSFEQEGQTWELTQIEGDGPDADDLSFTGLSVLRDGSPVEQRRCTGVEAANWSFLERVLHPISP